MCYNITYKSPPNGVRQSGLEPEHRRYGSVVQRHRVCHSTTGAIFKERRGNCESPSSLNPLNLHSLTIYDNIKYVIVKSLDVANNEPNNVYNESVRATNIFYSGIGGSAYALLSLLWFS